MIAEKLVYTACTHTTGGPEGGMSQSSDGHLDVKTSLPRRRGSSDPPLFQGYPRQHQRRGTGQHGGLMRSGLPKLQHGCDYE
jgi:hypothetical protein